MVYFSSPTSSFGYYRGSPQFGGQGSGQGQAVNGLGIFSQGIGTQGTGSGWSPTILYMFALIIVEMIVFGFLAKHV